MCKISLVLISLLCLVSQVVIAEEGGLPSSEVDSTIDERPESTDQKGMDRGYTWAMRAGYLGQLTPGFGLEVFKAMNDHLQVGAMTMIGLDWDKTSSIKGGNFSSSYDRATLFQSVTSAHARWFLSDSFAVTTSLGYEHAWVSYSVGSNRPTSNISGDIRGRSLFFGTSIGNFWKTSGGYQIGCDWLGIMIPFVKSVQVSDRNYNSPTQKHLENADAIETWGKRNTYGGITFMLLSLGTKF